MEKVKDMLKVTLKVLLHHLLQLMLICLELEDIIYEKHHTFL